MHLAELYFGCFVLIGFACLALLLLSIRLHDVDEQISYLKFIALEWFPVELAEVTGCGPGGVPAEAGTSVAAVSASALGSITKEECIAKNLRTITHYIDNFRTEIDNLIGKISHHV